jgi:protease-3
MRRILALFVALSAPFFSFAATNEIIRINGYEVHLVDTEHGSQILVEYMVPYGNKSDPTQFAGRAHFLEHLILKGTLRYPGYHTMSNEANEMRAQKNAFTGPGYTGFYIAAQESQAEKAIDLILSGLGGLEFLESTMKAELTAVDNEVSVEIPSKPFMRVLNGAFSEVLPLGHPLQRYDLGPSETLAALKVPDMQHLYYNMYQPENVKVMVAANFKHGSLSKAQVIEYLYGSLTPFDIEADPHGYANPGRFNDASALPSIVSEDGSLHPFVEMKTLDNSRLSAHVLEVDLSKTPVNPLALDVVNAYLQSDAKNSLTAELRAQGLITDLSLISIDVGDKNYFMVTSYMTEKGWAERQRLLQQIYQGVAGLIHRVDEASLEVIKSSLIYQKRKAYERAGGVVNEFMTLAQIDDPSYRALDFEAAYGSVTAAEVQSVLKRIFQPEKSLNFAIAPEVVGDEPSRYFKVSPGDPDRADEYLPVQKSDQSELIATLRATLELNATELPDRNPVFPTDVEIELTRNQSYDRADTGWKKMANKSEPIAAYMKELHGSKEAAVKFLVKLDMQNNFAAQMAFSILMSAFQEETVGLRAIFRNHGVTMVPQFSGFDLEFSGTSENSEALVQAFHRLIVDFRGFRLSKEQFERFKQELILMHERGISDGFLGSLVIDELADRHKGEVTNFQVRQVLESLTYEQTLDEIQNLHFSQRPALFAIGDLSPADLGELLDSAFYALGFTKADPENLIPSQRPAPITETEYIHTELPKGKSANSAGVVRAYSGPVLEAIEDVALANMVGAYLHPATFNINRSERGLGYVHGAALATVNRQSLMYFYGQVDHTDRIAEAEDGWETVIRELRSGEVDDATWEQYKQGFLAQLRSRPASLLQEADRTLNDFVSRGDIHWRAKLTEAVEAFEPGRVPSFVEQFVSDTPAFRQLEIRACARELRSS